MIKDRACISARSQKLHPQGLEMFQKLRYKSTPEDHPWLEASWMSTFPYISEILFSLRSQILPMSLSFSIWNTFCLVGSWVCKCGGVVVVVGIDRTQNGIQDCSKLVSLGGKMLAEFQRERQQEIHRAIIPVF